MTGFNFHKKKDEMSPEDLFQDVIDQDSAVAQLRKSSRNPVHAYLFVGPKGSL